MKSKLILTVIAAGALAFTACNKKVDEKTLADIKQFETDWTALGTQATTWSQELTAEKQKATEHLTKQTEMMAGSMDKIKDQATKDKLVALDKNDKDAVAALETMSNSWNEFSTQWASNTTAFTEWSAKVAKGEVSNEEATKMLTEWQAKLADAKTKVEGWQTAYNTTKENAEKNMAECEQATASLTAGTAAKK